MTRQASPPANRVPESTHNDKVILMPLPYTTLTPLSVPPDEFNTDGIAVLVMHGLLRDGEWTFKLHPGQGTPERALNIVYGSLSASIADTPGRDRSEFRSSPAFRDRGMESALFWLITETRRCRWRLAAMKDKTGIVAERDRPTLIIANIVLVNETFQPAPGSVLLDEQITGIKEPSS